MYQLMWVIFWFSAFALIYTYFGYPLLVYLVARLSSRNIAFGPYEPDVTVLITAYNEEKDIKEKLENTLALNYPQNKLEVIVASDGSTDRTDHIVKGFENRGVRLFRQEGRLGKTETQNNAVQRAKGEVILFSDATTMYRPDVLHALMPNFADSGIGCVAGKLVYVDKANSEVGVGAKSYWSYETFLKENESRACSLIGVSGCMYAVRKSAYVPMYPEACSDFLICTVVYRQGLKSVYEPKAVCFEETNDRSKTEFQMRVRIISQTFTDLWRNREMMNPFKNGFYAIQLISHKLMRYMVPYFLILVLVSSAILAINSTLFQILLLLQTVFYLAGVGSFLLHNSNRKLGILALPFYFLLSNFAAGAGFLNFVKGNRYARWEPARGA
jgi:cellulose synthase/poly-beta-1,6-N-acetylglucosamine synthase-like glycosyltransferase